MTGSSVQRDGNGRRSGWARLAAAGFAFVVLTATAVAQVAESTAEKAPVAPKAEGPIASLPHDLSPWGMFIAADYVVQSVMVGLFVASIITWTVGLAKSLELLFASRRLRRALNRISQEASLAGAYNRLEGGGGHSQPKHDA